MMATRSPLKKHILQQAIAVALSSPSKKLVGAILLKRNRLIASAVNMENKSHPVQKKFACLMEDENYHHKIYLHAEINCLIRAREDADTIVVARVGGHQHNELRNAKPCLICSAAIRSQGIRHVHYSTDEGFMYEYWD